MTWAETTEGEVGTAQLCLLHPQGKEWMTKGKTLVEEMVSTQSWAASACFILKQGILLQWVSSSLYLQQYVSEGKMNKNKQCKPFSGML